MVRNYLDGVHLKVLGLKGEDGDIYVYRASPEDFQKSEEIRPEVERQQKEIAELSAQAFQLPDLGKDNTALWKRIREELEPVAKPLKEQYEKLREEEIQKIISRAEKYSSRSLLPQFNYMVSLQRVRLSSFSERFVWCDEIRVWDNRKEKEIARSRRFLGYSTMVGVRSLGGSPFEGGGGLGDLRVYRFDDRVLFSYAKVNTVETDRNLFRREMYRLGSMYWRKKNKSMVIQDAK
ncbi:hypothetical protein [Desulfogranum japonicum]|uniref:hypothetical protein n=1 Tax=Desulfogranum japonicum TaxID=231447 RepID=UPI00041B2C37|nr:hypothetical protein [Desulfogranum japonicum]